MQDKVLLLHHNTEFFNRTEYDSTPIVKESLVEQIEVNFKGVKLRRFYDIVSNKLESSHSYLGLSKPRAQDFFEMKKVK